MASLEGWSNSHHKNKFIDYCLLNITLEICTARITRNIRGYMFATQIEVDHFVMETI